MRTKGFYWLKKGWEKRNEVEVSPPAEESKIQQKREGESGRIKRTETRKNLPDKPSR